MKKKFKKRRVEFHLVYQTVEKKTTEEKRRQAEKRRQKKKKMLKQWTQIWQAGGKQDETRIVAILGAPLACKECKLNKGILVDGICDSCEKLAKICPCQACGTLYGFYPSRDDYATIIAGKPFDCNTCQGLAKCIHCECDSDETTTFCDNCNLLGATCSKCFVAMPPLTRGRGKWHCLLCRNAGPEVRLDRKLLSETPQKKKKTRKRSLDNEPDAAQTPPLRKAAAAAEDDADGMVAIDLVSRDGGTDCSETTSRKRRQLDKTKIEIADIFADALFATQTADAKKPQIVQLKLDISDFEKVLIVTEEKSDHFAREKARARAQLEAADIAWKNSPSLTPENVLAGLFKCVDGMAATIVQCRKEVARVEEAEIPINDFLVCVRTELETATTRLAQLEEERDNLLRDADQLNGRGQHMLNALLESRAVAK